MNYLDQEIRAAVDRVVSTAPPPVPLDTILSTVPAEEPGSRRQRQHWVLALSSLVAAAVVVAVWMFSGDGEGGPMTEVEAVDVVELEDVEPARPDDTIKTEFSVPGGLWLSETVPQIANQVPTVTADDLWDTLERTEPMPPFAPTFSDLDAPSIPGLTSAQLRWEGLLLAGSYSIEANENANDIIERMHDDFVALTNDLGYDRAPEALGLSPYEVVIVASLVETTEASNDADRAKIATVVYNRLAEDLPLGLDSAYLYAAQDRDLEFTPSLLQRPGPYALRQNAGLPPTPIASPRRASLRAAIDPTPGPWLFYNPADNQGNFYFATTLEEHHANIAAARERGLAD